VLRPRRGRVRYRRPDTGSHEVRLLLNTRGRRNGVTGL
jgi:hypothetical protein